MRRDIHNSEVPILCRSCEARHRGVCGALDPAQLVRLSRHTIRREVPDGTELVAAGEPITRLGNILSGVVKLIMAMPDGRQQIVGLQFAPDFLARPFAEVSEVRAEAAGPVRVCTFPRAALEAMAREAPELGRRLHDQHLRELDEARGWMLTLGRKTAAERVASFLLFVARHADPEGVSDRRVDIPLTRADIADFLGLTVETVSRQFSALRRSGFISLEISRSVRILDPVGLETVAGG